MKSFKLILGLILSAVLIWWTYYLISFEVDGFLNGKRYAWFLYWIIVPISWLKTTFFGFHLVQSLVLSSREFTFNNFKLMPIWKRIGAHIIDLICVGFYWLLLLLVSALIILPFYKQELITYDFPQDYGYLDCFNLVFGYGWYVYIFAYCSYFFLLEKTKNSTFGKMMTNSGIISIENSRAKWQQILIKSLLRIIPINEILIYFKGFTLNEMLSKTRTVSLDESTQKRYDTLIEKYS